MKFQFLLLLVVVACSKPSGSSKNNTAINPVIPDAVVDISDPLVPGENQQQDDGEFQLERNYNGVNVVLTHNSSRRLGMIRIKGKDSEKLHNHMTLSTIKLQSSFVKNDLEAKVGKHVMCRQESCWVYIDYKNADVLENERTSEKAKAPKLVKNYRGENLDLVNDIKIDFPKIESFPLGRIQFTGMDAKALYSVMDLAEIEIGGKGASKARKTGNGVTCTRSLVMDKDEKEKSVYECKLELNYRSGEVKLIRE